MVTLLNTVFVLHLLAVVSPVTNAGTLGTTTQGPHQSTRLTLKDILNKTIQNN